MISSLELCQIVESGFLPMRCRCTVDAAGLMSIQLFDARNGHADLMASGIPTTTLTTSRAIAALVGGLKEQLTARSQGEPVYRARQFT
jgi:hypothetical protein